jgi:hypothetical protein
MASEMAIWICTIRRSHDRNQAINAKPARQAMPTLRITKSDNLVELATTHTDKAVAIAAISFPNKDDDPIPPTPKVTPGAPPFQP